MLATNRLKGFTRMQEGFSTRKENARNLPFLASSRSHEQTPNQEKPSPSQKSFSLEMESKAIRSCKTLKRRLRNKATSVALKASSHPKPRHKARDNTIKARVLEKHSSTCLRLIPDVVLDDELWQAKVALEVYCHMARVSPCHGILKSKAQALVARFFGR